jgi:hypothetical protein
VQTIRASARHERAIAAIDDLLSRQRLEHLFVGSVARAAWLGGLVDGGAVDVLALMQGQQKNNVATMASHRGFRVDRDEIEATEELDLVPLMFVDEGGDVRVHVLVASNALYARMFASSATARFHGRENGTVRGSSSDPRSSSVPRAPSAEEPRGTPRNSEEPRTLRIPSREDAALLLAMAEDDDAVRRLVALPEFDLRAYNEKLTSIGLGAQAL